VLSESSLLLVRAFCHRLGCLSSVFALLSSVSSQSPDAAFGVELPCGVLKVSTGVVYRIGGSSSERRPWKTIAGILASAVRLFPEGALHAMLFHMTGDTGDKRL
jgi:hypothetical protein